MKKVLVIIPSLDWVTAGGAKSGGGSVVAHNLIKEFVKNSDIQLTILQSPSSSIKQFEGASVVDIEIKQENETLSSAVKNFVDNKSLKDEDALKYCDYLSDCFDKKVYLCKMMPEVVYNIKNSQILGKPSKIIAFSAIGQPNQFYNYLKKDYRLLAVVDFEDHHSYTKSDILRLLNIAKQEGVNSIVTTEKDAVKIKPLLEEIELNDVGIYSLKLKAILDLEEILNG